MSMGKQDEWLLVDKAGGKSEHPLSQGRQKGSG